jgi:hypothetical protein
MTAQRPLLNLVRRYHQILPFQEFIAGPEWEGPSEFGTDGKLDLPCRGYRSFSYSGHDGRGRKKPILTAEQRTGLLKMERSVEVP